MMKSLSRIQLHNIWNFPLTNCIMAKALTTSNINNILLNRRVAVLFQAQIPPMRNGIIKPMKPGGYSDSGADIAFCLRQLKVDVITSSEKPVVDCDFDWVFPDTDVGIKEALKKGADILWLNTILYEGHPVEKFIEDGIEVVGQVPKYVDIHDDKWVTNNLLKSNNFQLPKAILLTYKDVNNLSIDFPFPVVLKPIRGRGSQGVQVIEHIDKLNKELKIMVNSKIYGESVYAEEFLPGQEITITVLPPGCYIIDQKFVNKVDYWSLPAVRRFNHHDGVAPYNGVVAVVENSEVLRDEELNSQEIKSIEKCCEEAAKLVHGRAPIRIDCRKNVEGEYIIFDLNMKPNMTGPSRPHRLNQDSLTAIAAKRIRWSYPDLLVNLLLQRWNEPIKSSQKAMPN